MAVSMDLLTLALIFVTFFFAAFLKGTAGLGFATTCLGIMAAYLDMRVAIPLVIIPSLLSNALVMIDAGGFLSILRRFKFMFLAALPGLALGLWLLGGSSSTMPRLVLGAAMILYSGGGLWGGTLRLTQRPLLDCAVGVVTGTVNGLTGSQIMPILPYLMALPISKDELVQAINTSFTLSSIIMLVGLNRLGLVSTELVAVSFAGLVPVFLGIHIGGRIRRKLPEAAFRKIVFALIGLLGVGLVFRAFL
ncbi:sulfite exporter TauE/SafE family protein [uncultured Pseudodesulfovibrio sp.]|uniref:sulfite exporter TauE/SafE family protein n=1 Tax=uncultured Pseudodesulfovibrio sp. TaxID=2035858 RepID=UPI003748DBA3